jgi:hypothetical protein
MQTVEIRTENNPAPVPPNHALAITAPNNEQERIGKQMLERQRWEKSRRHKKHYRIGV